MVSLEYSNKYLNNWHVISLFSLILTSTAGREMRNFTLIMNVLRLHIGTMVYVGLTTAAVRSGTY